MIKKMFLEADPDKVEIKKLLGKDFLELSMRTVSSANPNRNGSWFTKEAQEKALETYNNKPVLGFFSNGDFVSHDGAWKHDPDTGMDFWDTLGVKGERPLGIIRESDRKEVVFDEATGLYWTEITCALWTQYSYRQVKRLIEDAKRAAKEGGPTKNISVEVDITDWEEMDDGVLKIKDYNLVGVTILGSRNGKKVAPGIDGAELSVLDVISKELYERQRHSLMQAYERLDGDMPKKEESDMPTEEKRLLNEGELCPDCGKNPCECEEKHECNEGGCDPEPKVEEEAKKEPAKLDEDKPEGGEDPEKKDPEPEEKDDDDEKKDPEDPKKEDEEVKEPEEGKKEQEEQTQKFDQGTSCICDLAWIIGRHTEFVSCLEDTCHFYEQYSSPFKGKELVIKTLKRMLASCKAELVEMTKLAADIAAENYEEDKEKEEFEDKLSEHCSLPELYGEYVAAEAKIAELNAQLEAKGSECEEAKKEIESLHFASFIEKAGVAIDAAKGTVPEEDVKSIFERCEKKEISTLEALENELALAAGKAALANKNAKTASYSAPVPTFPIPEQKSKAAEAKDPFTRMGYKAKK